MSSFQTASEVRQWETLEIVVQEAVVRSPKLQWSQDAGGARNVQACREELRLLSRTRPIEKTFRNQKS